MTNEEKVENIEEINELSSELSSEELKAVSGGFHPDEWDEVIDETTQRYPKPWRR
jgi:hypothetical protein